LGWNNVPQPNIVLRVVPECGGKSRTTSERILSEAPELMVDFTTSHQTFDVKDKIRAFRENGVTEYLAWRSDDQKLEWFCLERGGYSLNLPDSNGVLESHSFPGLRLNLTALLNRSSSAVMATLRKSLQSGEHAAFVVRLERRRELDEAGRSEIG